MASVHLSGPRVAAAAKPAALGGLLLTPRLTMPRGRGARGLVVRAATVVSPKVTNRAPLSCWDSVITDLQGWWPVFGSVGIRRYYARMRNLKILCKRDECCAETKLIVVVGEIARKTENPSWSRNVLVVIH